MVDEYFMESSQEGERIAEKTDVELLKKHLALAGIIGGTEKIKIVDVGCGPGISTIFLAQIYPNAEVIGIDASIERLRDANIRKENMQIPNVKFIQGDIYHLPLESNVFDIVWSRFLFEYLTRPQEAIQELKRVLKLGGKMAIADLDGNGSFIYPLSPPLQEAIHKLEKTFMKIGFDPFIGRKLYSLFYTACFKEIRIEALPYHLIYQNKILAPHESRKNWQKKIETLKKNYKEDISAILGSADFLDEFLSSIFSPSTLTYSVIFIISAKK